MHRNLNKTKTQLFSIVTLKKNGINHISMVLLWLYERETKQEGQKTVMNGYGFYNFEFGILKIGYTDTAIAFVKKVEHIDEENKASPLSDLAFSQIQEYLAGKRRIFDFPYTLSGTPFQEKVWSALCHIPYGQTCSYKDIAMAIGNPKASRAVGMANNKNPITIVVPCHRVIGAKGTLVGYAGGIPMKQSLLGLESKWRD